MGTGGFLTLGHQRILSLRWKLHNDYKLRSHQLTFFALAFLLLWSLLRKLLRRYRCVHLLATLSCADTVNTGLSILGKALVLLVSVD